MVLFTVVETFAAVFREMCCSCTLAEGLVGYAAESVVVSPCVEGLFTIISGRCNELVPQLCKKHCRHILFENLFLLLKGKYC